MKHFNSQLVSATKAKYFKYKTRLERSISSGRFEGFSRRKKNNLISKVEKFRFRLENGVFTKGVAVAGTLAAGMAMPNIAAAQNPDFRQFIDALPIPDDARNVEIANIDGDPELEIIVSTVSGGYIINGNDVDGFTATNPAGLVEMTGEFEVGDVDGDGNLDLVYHDGLFFDAAINDGDGNFAASTPLLAMSNGLSDFQLVDIDSDLDLDIAFALSAYNLNFSLNDGSGSFSSASYLNTGSRSLESIVLADLDGDGDTDLVATTYSDPGIYDYGRASVFENTTNGIGLPYFGAGYFPAVDNEGGTFDFKYVQAEHLEVVDFDNDGDLDFFFGRAGSADVFFAENNYDGTGTLDFDLLTVPTVSNIVNNISIFDFENDGNKDALISNGAVTSLFESNGTGFVRKDLDGAYGQTYESFLDVATGDIDGDGKIDIVGINANSNYAYFDRSGPQALVVSYNEFSERTAEASAVIGVLIATDVDKISMGGQTFTLATGNGVNDADNARFSITGNELIVGASALDFETQASFNILVNITDGDLSTDIALQLHLEDYAEAGHSTFEATAPAVENVRMFSPILADIDGDGDDELIYKRNSGNGFIYIEDDLTDATGTSVAYGNVFKASDFDNDGDMDIVTQNGTDFYIYLNDGAGSFLETYGNRLGSFGPTVYDFEVADFNNDGLNDIVKVASNGVEVWLNDGDRTFTQGTFSFTSSGVERIEVGDFDGDGQVDMVFENGDYFYIYRNDGNDYFSETGSYYIGYHRDMEVADFDGDGDLDIMVGAYNELYILDGYGDGYFDQLSFSIPYVNDNETFAVGDVDGDMDLDIALVSYNASTGGEEARILLNDGSNGFTEIQAFDLPDPESNFRGIVLGDVDGDDDLDLVVSGGEYRQVLENKNIAPYLTGFTGRIIVDENTATGTDLGQILAEDLNSDAITSIALADGDNNNDLFVMDGSGNITLNGELDWEALGSDLQLDIEVTDDQGNSRIENGYLKLNNLSEGGNGTFDEEQILLFGNQTAEFFAAGDYDMDGDMDLFKSTDVYYGPSEVLPGKGGPSLGDSGYANSIFQQNGGSFSDIPMENWDYQKYGPVVFIDYDNDGDLDVFGFSDDQNDLEIGINNEGSFDERRQIDSAQDVYAIETGDFDNDGLMEVAVFMEQSLDYIVRTFEIDEGGEFNPGQNLVMNSSAGGGLVDGLGEMSDIALADFNGDGLTDLFVSIEDGDDVIFFHGGEAISTSYSVAITQIDYGFSEVEVGDINGDGNIDILVSRDTDSQESVIDVYQNDGSGVFSLLETIGVTGQTFFDFKLGDVDGDGSLDLIVSSYQDYGDGTSGYNIEIHTNDGAGDFTLVQTIPDANADEIILMDVDGDDALDIVAQRVSREGDEDSNKLFAIKNVNMLPTAINLSNAILDEHLDLDTEIAIITVDDPNPGDTHILSLITGDGVSDMHNGYFTISGNSLRVTQDISFEATPTLNILVSAYDGYQTYEQAFILSVNDVNIPPTGISLSAISFDEGTTPGTAIATIQAIDVNPESTHTFALATGDGTNDADNGAFLVEGNSLIVTTSSNFETKSGYNVYLSASDEDGSVEQAFLIGVNDVNQAPTAIALSNSNLDEGTTPGTVIGSLSVTDPNATDTHTLSLVVGNGTNDANNNLFVITGSNLILVGDVNFDSNPTLSILVSASDGAESFAQALTLTVNDVLGIADEAANSLGVYPNPGNERLEINLDNTLRGQMTIRISDLQGKVIHRYESEKLNNVWTDRLDMTGKEPGIYLIELTIGDERFSQRWIKE